MMSGPFLFCIILLFLYIIALFLYFFFFSSRRRHTRLVSDWSSDVCSSDLKRVLARLQGLYLRGALLERDRVARPDRADQLRRRGLGRDEEDNGSYCSRSEIGRASCRERV